MREAGERIAAEGKGRECLEHAHGRHDHDVQHERREGSGPVTADVNPLVSKHEERWQCRALLRH